MTRPSSTDAVATPASFAGVSFAKSLSALSYCWPMLFFGVGTAVEGWLPLRVYPIAYALKTAAVVMALIVWRGPLQDVRPSMRVLAGSIALGLAVFALWVGLDRIITYPHIGSRVAFNPLALPGTGFWAFLAVRMFGLVIVVPVMEEVFWRAFLLRYLTTPAFTTLAIGAFSWTAFWGVVGLSAVSHPEWLAAAIANMAYSLWVRRTRDLFSAVVAHATTNLALGIFVLATHAWWYW